MSRLRYSCLPHKVYDFLYGFKSHFRCAQARHFRLFCWLLVGLILAEGRGTLKALTRHLPTSIRYWALLRMLRSGQWDSHELLHEMSGQVLDWLPAPPDGVLYLTGDGTLKEKRGKKHPVAHKTRLNCYAVYTFGFEMVMLLACWGHYRIPVDIALVDHNVKGHQNQLFREMIECFEAPRWAQQVVVLGDAGFSSSQNLATIAARGFYYVMAVPRTRKFTDGKNLTDLVRHLPRNKYRRIASYKPDGRRCDYWVFSRRAQLHNVGDVTLVLSKKRRNDGPKQTKIIVTNLPLGNATKPGSLLSMYSRRWEIEVAFKELKGGLHLGRMQVTRDKARVERSVRLSVQAYLLLLRLYGREAISRQEVSIFYLKQRFANDMCEEHWKRSEQRWTQKLSKIRLAM